MSNPARNGRVRAIQEPKLVRGAMRRNLEWFDRYVRPDFTSASGVQSRWKHTSIRLPDIQYVAMGDRLNLVERCLGRLSRLGVPRTSAMPISRDLKELTRRRPSRLAFMLADLIGRGITLASSGGLWDDAGKFHPDSV